MAVILVVDGILMQIYHEGKICLTVHFRRAHTSDGTGLASWWNQVHVVHGGLSWVLVGG